MNASSYLAAAIAIVALFADAADAQFERYPFVEVSTPTAPDRVIMTYGPDDGHVEVNAPHEIRYFEFLSNSGVFDVSELAHPEEFQGPFNVVKPVKIFKTLDEVTGFGTFMELGNVVPADMDFDGFTSEFRLDVRLVGFLTGEFEQMSDPPGYGLYILSALSIPGDYNGDGRLDAADLDMQAAEMKKPAEERDLAKFDHNNDGLVNVGDAGPDQSKWGDRLIWIRTLRETWVGDVNMDGIFDSIDLVLALQGSKYAVDAGNAQMATWVEGDWNGDMVFDSGDLVFAFQDGGYVASAALAVAEPTPFVTLLVGLIGITIRRRHLRAQTTHLTTHF